MVESKHLIDNSGIFLGLSTIPLPLKQGKAFFRREIQEGIFKQYKERIRQFSFNRTKDDAAYLNDFDRYFYEVRAYYLFGKFDLAVLSVVDDFRLGSKTFHPYSHLTEEALAAVDGRLLQPENFTFQTLTGYSPQMITEYPSLLEHARATFLADVDQPKEQRFPLFASCSLKLNSAFTIGGGNNFSQLAASMIYSRLEASLDYKEHFDFIILQTFSWNEFTVLFFADSYETITKHILQIRELSVKELSMFDYGKNALLDFVQREALMAKFLAEQPNPLKQMENAHIFVYSQTVFGFDIALFDATDGEVTTDKNQFKPILDDSLQLNMQLFVKPGHLKTVAQYFDQKERKWRLHIGSGDFIYPVPNGNLQQSYHELLNNTDLGELDKHIRGIQTHPELKLDTSEIAGEVVENHYFYTSELYQLAFGVETLRELRGHLVRCKVSKTVRQRVINMFVNYNNGIQDPVLYTYFIDLRPFLQKTLRDIEGMADEKTRTVEETSDMLDVMTNDFEKAFRNRFHQSHLMSDITDFNIEFNGGVQQLVSLFDSAYKIMASVLLIPYDKRPTLGVSSISGIVANDNLVEMSYAHLLQPSLFLSTGTASAAKAFLSLHQGQEFVFERFRQKTAIVQELSLIEQLPFLEDLSDLFGDMINYYITFNGDTNLFLFWYWHYFLQNPNMYNQQGTVNEELFLLYLLRLMLLFEYLDPESGHFREKVLAPAHDLQDLWFRWFPRTRQKIDEILNEPAAQELDDWFQLAKSVIEDKLIIDNYAGLVDKKIETEEEKIKLYQQILRNNDAFALTTDLFDLEMELIRSRSEEMRYLSEQISLLIKQGRVYDPDVLSARSAAFYLQAVVLGYLKLLYDECQGNLSVLYRTEESGKPADTYEGATDYRRIYPKYTFDPRGGLFLTSIQSRRDYFKYRIALYNSINGIASKMKKELF